MRCISSSKICGSLYTSRRTRSGSTYLVKSGMRSCNMGPSGGGDDNLRAFIGGEMGRIAPLVFLFCCAVASAQTPLKVKMFPGAQSLPALAAVQQGMFERQGLKVEVLFTANSDEQRAGLA